MAVLAEGNVASRIPAQDLRRARSFYAEKLGLEPVEERPGGLRYRCGNGEFALFESAGPLLEITRRWRGRSTTWSRQSRSFASAA
jgi:catechol 2,3-dioxygenase-like lactoylglutathione lyase family enzyme